MPGFGDEESHHIAPDKYYFTEHAERNALYNTLLCTKATSFGGALFCPAVACPDCARAIVKFGIAEVYCHEECMVRFGKSWQEAIAAGLDILRRAGIKVVRYSGELGEVHALTDGKLWMP